MTRPRALEQTLVLYINVMHDHGGAMETWVSRHATLGTGPLFLISPLPPRSRVWLESFLGHWLFVFSSTVPNTGR